MSKFVSYIRVSTTKQGDSGLGIEAQQAINNRYIQSQSGICLKEAIEVETGTNKKRYNTKEKLDIDVLLKDRPILRECISFCQKEKATLVVKDLSRLGRNQLLISYLIQVGINFICADSPSDSPMILQIKTAVAEEEARQISTRTKQALQAKKERGEKLGSDNIREVGKLGALANKLKSLEAYKTILPTIEDLYSKYKSPTKVANELNKLGFRTVNNKLFAPTTVFYLINRLNLM